MAQNSSDHRLPDSSSRSVPIRFCRRVNHRRVPLASMPLFVRGEPCRVGCARFIARLDEVREFHGGPASPITPATPSCRDSGTRPRQRRCESYYRVPKHGHWPPRRIRGCLDAVAEKPHEAADPGSLRRAGFPRWPGWDSLRRGTSSHDVTAATVSGPPWCFADLQFCHPAGANCPWMVGRWWGGRQSARTYPESSLVIAGMVLLGVVHKHLCALV
jgi:hypothetical protein